ncbi:hypothetical protein [Natronosalvus halobius]|uniref:hypothetical protein n=1 Tax=Natronosalvus halobius TaxID=2953746 RepID=UPI00209F6B95|nr:hypothetical protein [Natronosalvus halobius]USZ71988.1 hypothetical protein NGM15_01380 [Natronosalvus halobius]
MQTTPQEDCLLIVALTRFEVEFRDADPILAEKAWLLAEKFASTHGLEPTDAAMQLEWPSDKE